MHSFSYSGNRRYPIFLLACLGALLIGCSGGGGGDDCSVRKQNRFVHLDMLDRYYWYDRVPQTLDYDDFSSPEETLAFLRYEALDRFSYIASQEAFNNLFNNGTYIGYGFAFVIADDGRVLLRFVYDQSPAAASGFERGDEILAVNGQSAAIITAANGWNQAFGEAQIGLVTSLQLRRKNGNIETINLTKAVVTINTVLHSEIIPSGANNIGYLVFNSFLNTSPAELDPVFAQFGAAGVSQLILDLRYNSGGSTDVARDLASYLRDTPVSNQDLFVQLRYNARYQSSNFNVYLRPLANSLGLNEVTVITTSLTCSASEQIVSALQPYFSRVTTIGSASCGKPVGQNPRNFCDKTLVAVNFASFNAAGQGEYFSGIPADCSASDDPGFAFGDPGEPLLQAARFFVDNSTCPPVPRLRGWSAPMLPGLQELAGAV